MPPTSSAEPQELYTYDVRSGALSHDLHSLAGSLNGALDRFSSSCTEGAFRVDVGGLPDSLRSHSGQNGDLGRWVAGVGQKFEEADSGSLFGRAPEQYSTTLTIEKPDGMFDLPDWFLDWFDKHFSPNGQPDDEEIVPDSDFYNPELEETWGERVRGFFESLMDKLEGHTPEINTVEPAAAGSAATATASAEANSLLDLEWYQEWLNKWPGTVGTFFGGLMVNFTLIVGQALNSLQEWLDGFDKPKDLPVGPAPLVPAPPKQPPKLPPPMEATITSETVEGVVAQKQPKGSYMCGPASGSMLMAYYHALDPDNPEMTMQEIADEMGSAYSDATGITYVDLANGLDDIDGYQATTHTRTSKEELMRMVEEGPVIAQVHLNMTTNGYGHMIVVHGFSDDGNTVHYCDPWTGEDTTISWDDFAASFNSDNFGGTPFPDSTGVVIELRPDSEKE